MRIAWDNKVKEATISASSENSYYPWEDALKDIRLSRVGRTISTTLYLDLNQDGIIAVKCLAILRHNLTKTAVVKIEGAANLKLDSGLTWTALAAPQANAWNGIATDGNGVWIGLAYSGTNRIMRSPDNGLTWTMIHAPEANLWRKIATDGKGVWIGVAEDGTNQIMRSADNGLTWTALAAPEANAWVDIATDGKGVWIGLAYSGTNQIMRSADNGLTWTALAAPEIDDWCNIATDGKGVWTGVAMSGYHRFMRSADNGLTWTVIVITGLNEWSCIATDSNGVWIGLAYSGTNQIMRSADNGLTWTALAAPEANEWVDIATDGKGVWIGVATNGAHRIMGSADNGLTWTALVAPEANEWVDIATDGKGVWIGVAISGTHRIMRTELELVIDWENPDFSQILNIDLIINYLFLSNCKYWKLSIIDTSNPDGFIEISKIFLGSYLQCPRMKIDQEIEVATTSESEFSSSGQVYGNEGYEYRAPKINFGNMTNAQKDEFNEMFRSVKNVTPVIVDIWAERTDMEPPLYCVIDQESLIWKRTGDEKKPWTTSIKFREVF